MKTLFAIIGIAILANILMFVFYATSNSYAQMQLVEEEYYLFEPKKDITVYELAEIIALEKKRATKYFILRLSPNTQRHFKLSSNK